MFEVNASSSTSLLLNILIGVLILLAGRRMLWLFLGGMAFIYTYNYAQALGVAPTSALQMAVVVGVFGVLLGFFVQKASLRFIGFLAGGAIIVNLMEFVATQASTDLSGSYLFLFLVGGVLGFFLMRYLVDWVVIVLSALVGAILITQTLPIDPLWQMILLLGLTIVGMVVQITQLRRK